MSECIKNIIEITRSEYAVELYDKNTNIFWLQIDVCQSLDEAKKLIESLDPAPSDLYYGILKIDYDEDDNEINVERVEL